MAFSRITQNAKLETRNRKGFYRFNMSSDNAHFDSCSIEVCEGDNIFPLYVKQSTSYAGIATYVKGISTTINARLYDDNFDALSEKVTYTGTPSTGILKMDFTSPLYLREGQIVYVVLNATGLSLNKRDLNEFDTPCKRIMDYYGVVTRRDYENAGAMMPYFYTIDPANSNARVSTPLTDSYASGSGYNQWEHSATEDAPIVGIY